VTGLRATSESRDVVDDPSQDTLFELFRDLETGNGTFLIVESLADTGGQTYVQAARSDDGAYVVEYRQGRARQHFQTHVGGFLDALALVSGWAFGTPGWHDRAVWTPISV
jgi:hypothetical protein